MQSPPAVASPPSLATRLLYFVIGGGVGGLVGVGIVTSGPGPAPSVFEFPAAVWVFGIAAACAILSAAWPAGVLRLARSWSTRDRNR
ncbi:MAG: hypothetical protein U1F51_00135 [Burkholderiales bacterium]